MENCASSLTCSLVIDQFAHFALHDGERFPRLLLHQQPQLPQVGKCEQVVHAIALKGTSHQVNSPLTGFIGKVRLD